MNVYELHTGKPRITNPRFQDLAGACYFPGWFVFEVSSLLASPEPYAIAAGVGLIARLSPFVASNYEAVNKGDDAHALPIWHVFEWAEHVGPALRDNIAESFVHEIDDIVDGLSVMRKLYVRNATACASYARTLKQRRDDLESVGFISVLFKRDQHLIETAKIDAIANSYQEFFNDNIRQGIDERLRLIKRVFPSKWWGTF